MKRLSWHASHRRRCRIRWMRAGMPVPNHMLDPTAFRLVFEPWRVKLRRKMRRAAYSSLPPKRSFPVKVRYRVRGKAEPLEYP